MNAIEVSALHKSFGKVHALRGVDLTVPRGACMGLIGPNGAGKTTLIKAVLGILFPTSGNLTVLGSDPSKAGVRRRIGYLPERLELPPAYTPLTFLRSVASFKGVKTSRETGELKSLLETVGLDEGAWNRKCGLFSKGMKQRTGLAAALLGNPELLILDEPTDGIDPIGRAEVRQAILAAKKRGATILLNSHLLAETEKICDSVAMMNDGAVLQTSDIGVDADAAVAYITIANATATDFDPVRFGLDLLPGKTNSFQLEGDQSSVDSCLRALLDAGVSIVEVSRPVVDLEAELTAAVANTHEEEGRS